MTVRCSDLCHALGNADFMVTFLRALLPAGDGADLGAEELGGESRWIDVRGDHGGVFATAPTVSLFLQSGMHDVCIRASFTAPVTRVAFMYSR